MAVAAYGWGQAPAEPVVMLEEALVEVSSTIAAVFFHLMLFASGTAAMTYPKWAEQNGWPQVTLVLNPVGYPG